MNPTDLIKQLELITGQKVQLAPKNYTILPCELLNQKKNDLLVNFVDYIFDELNLWDDQPSNISLLASRLQNSSLPSTTTAYYSPETQEVCVYIGGRAFADWFRSLAHELAHKGQFHKGNLLKITAKDGLNCEQALEDEANFMAGRLVRAFGKVHPEIYNEDLLQ